MLSERLCIYEYEEVLLGQKTHFDCALSRSIPMRDRCIEAGHIWRYAVSHLLHWTPQEAVVYMTDKVVDMLCLDKTFDPLDFRRENHYVPDYRFFLQFAFPSVVRFSLKEQTISEYEKAARIGQWSVERGVYKYPKKFFVGDEGHERARICLTYAIDQFLRGTMTNEEMYAFFANKVTAGRWLKSKALTKPQQLTSHSPLEYFHNTLPARERDAFLYNFQRLNEACRAEMRRRRKDDAASAAPLGQHGGEG